MNRTRLKALGFALLGVLGARGALADEGIAQTGSRNSVQLPDRSLSVVASRMSAGPRRGSKRADLTVTLKNTGKPPLTVSRSDFFVSAEGDMFGAQAWDGRKATVAIGPRRSRVFRLSFTVPGAGVNGAELFYRPAAKPSPSASLTITGSSSGGPSTPGTRPKAHSSSAAGINTFFLTGGRGEPWGTAIDSSGNIWFAEPGCDFAPTCSSSTPPGQIGEVNASSHAVTFHTLPSISGNQPIFLTFDSSGHLWFTTPNNSMIGEFDPSSGSFLGQWPVTAGSGPWDLTFGGGKIWYTEHLVSAVGSFDPSSHAFQNFQTPSANSQPYGIAANGSSIWFTENNSNVDRVAVLNTKNNAISEYPIVQPLSGTPHLLSIDPNGDPWWTEGFSATIATLNPSAATPGQCGTTAGTCNGIRRFQLPAPTSCSKSGTHVSGIAYQSSANLVWLDDSLTAQVGSFNPSNGGFALSTLSNCGAHPHDGLNLDNSGNVWFDEEFANALGELIP